MTLCPPGAPLAPHPTPSPCPAARNVAVMTSPPSPLRPFSDCERSAIRRACQDFPHAPGESHFPAPGVCLVGLHGRAARLTTAEVDSGPPWLDAPLSAWLLLGRLYLAPTLKE